MKGTKNFRVFLCFIFFIPCVNSTLAQDTLIKTADSAFYNYFKLKMFENIFDKSEVSIDTSLNGFQKYELDKFAQTLGNAGKAYKSFFFSPQKRIGFNLGFSPFDVYKVQHNEVKYYNVKTPFSDLYYVMGSNKEQILRVVHTQNLGKDLNVGLNYNIINSVGSFRRMRTDVSNFVLFGHYGSKNKRYKVFGNIILNKCNNHESGGLVSMQDYEDEILGRADMYDVRIINAQNRSKDRGVFVKQYYNFNKKSVNEDSVSTAKPVVFNTHLSHTVHWKREGRIYEDYNPTGGYYPLTHYDAVYTGDSLSFGHLFNELSLMQVLTRNKKQQPSAFVELAFAHQYYDYKNFISVYNDSVVPVVQEKQFAHQFIPRAKLGIRLTEHTNIILNAYRITGNYNDGDYGYCGIFESKNATQSIHIKWAKDVYMDAYQHTNYFSNHFRWSYNFDKTSLNSIDIAHHYKGFKTNLSFYHIDNYVYHDAFARPKQYKNDIQIIRGAIRKDFRYKSLCFDNIFYVQKSSNENLLPLPVFATHQSVYYNTFMFKKALFTQIGIDFYYNSSYYAYAYMPALQQFYLQSHTLTGNYPVFDVFINLYIKNARLFVKAHHLNEGIIGAHAYTTPLYPMQGLSFKFGVSWMFKD